MMCGVSQQVASDVWGLVTGGFICMGSHSKQEG